MSAPLRISNRSEIAPLEVIVTSPPGIEFEFMLPHNLERFVPAPGGGVVPNKDYLLFDDLVLLSAMQAEHAQLTAVLRAVVGDTNHATFRDLLAGTLYDDQARADVIEDVLVLEQELYGVPDDQLRASRAGLLRLEPTALAEALLSGREPRSRRRLLRWPAPNTLFARDLGAAAGDAIIVTHAAEPARRRDMRLSRAVFTHHPLFRDTPKIDIAHDGPLRAPGQPAVTLEAGDIQVLSDRVALVGIGVRTTLTAARRLARHLFARGFEVLLACEMPRTRAAMHIDTLFTQIDHDHCLIYPPLFRDPGSVGARVYQLTPEGDGVAERVVGSNLLTALADVGLRLEPILCGGEDPITQAREQWSDGANAFAVAPGVIITYGRNEVTLRELNRAGYEIVEPPQFVRNASLYMRPDHRPVAVALQGHELVRGRGGPRCLTLPLRRGPL